jgi:hypothetical protein
MPQEVGASNPALRGQAQSCGTKDVRAVIVPRGRFVYYEALRKLGLPQPHANKHPCRTQGLSLARCTT